MLSRRFDSIGTRLLGLVGLSLLLPIIIVAGVTFFLLKDELVDAQENQARQLAGATQNVLRASLLNLSDKLKRIAGSNQVAELKAAFNAAPLAEFLDTDQSFFGLEVALEGTVSTFSYFDGDIRYAEKDLRALALFDRCVATPNKVHWSGVVEENGEPMVLGCLQQLDFYDNPTGIFVGYGSLASFKHLSLSLIEDDSAVILILDADGAIVSARDAAVLGLPIHSLQDTDTALWAALNPTNPAIDYRTVFRLMGQPVHVFRLQGEQPSWPVIVAFPTSLLDVVFNEYEQKVIALSLLLFCLIGFTAWRFARSIIQPVELLTASVDHIAEEGRFDQPIHVQAKGEVRRLAEHFNRMLKLVGDKQAELQQANASLMAAKERAEAASQAKSVFLGRMSHELRTPLNAILGFAGLLKRQATKDALSERYLSGLSSIEAGGDRLMGMVTDVFDFIQVSGEECTLARVPCSVQDCFDLIKHSAQVSPDQVELSIESSTLWVSADPKRLKQVMLELVNNAHKHSEGEGRISLRAHLDGQQVCIAVQDSGPGIAEADHQKIFEPFTRLARAEKNEVQGTGIGLSLVQVLVEGMGGQIAVESTVESIEKSTVESTVESAVESAVESQSGEGSVFRVWLPVADAAEQKSSRQNE